MAGLHLRLCPTCTHWFPTRTTRVLCTHCRHVARRRAQLRQLGPERQRFARKLQKNGYSLVEAVRAAGGGVV